jgi:hypothetical protein
MNLEKDLIIREYVASGRSAQSKLNPNGQSRFSIPSLSGRGWGKFEADPDAVDRLAPHGKRCIKHALRLCLDRVFRGFPNAKKPIDVRVQRLPALLACLLMNLQATTNYLLSNHSIWSLIASARALDPNSSPEVVIVEVELSSR